MRAIASILLPAIELPFAPFSPPFVFRAVPPRTLAFSFPRSFSLSLSFSFLFLPLEACVLPTVGMRPAVRISWHLRLVRTTEFLRRLSLTVLHSQKKCFSKIKHYEQKRNKNLQIFAKKNHLASNSGELNIFDKFDWTSYMFYTKTIEIKCYTLIISFGLIFTTIFLNLYYI